MSRGQIYVTVGRETKDDFLVWCNANGYEPKRVFLAGWVALQRMTHDERTTLFAAINHERKTAPQPVGSAET